MWTSLGPVVSQYSSIFLIFPIASVPTCGFLNLGPLLGPFLVPCSFKCFKQRISYSSHANVQSYLILVLSTGFMSLSSHAVVLDVENWYDDGLGCLEGGALRWRFSNGPKDPVISKDSLISFIVVRACHRLFLCSGNSLHHKALVLSSPTRSPANQKVGCCCRAQDTLRLPSVESFLKRWFIICHDMN